jgi:uncharacterized protein (TIRG00374 family)
MASESQERPRSRWKSAVPAPLRHGILLFLVVLVIEYLVVPELIGASRNLSLLKRLNIGWLIAGIAFEAASLFAYALLTYTVLPRERPTISRLFRIDLSTTAVGHLIPGGSAASAGLGYRLLTGEGVAGTDAAFTMATLGMGSAVVLNVMLWLALVISIPFAGFHPIDIVVALLGMIALLAFGALVYTFTRGEGAAKRFVRRIERVLPRVKPDQIEAVLLRIDESLRLLGQNRERRRSALIWASSNWLLDAASLWSFLAALGKYVNPVELFAAYGIANVLAVIPITPGGIGFVEASLPLVLTSFGVVKNVSLLGVLGWRLVNFWLPIPVGALCYLSLRVPKGQVLRGSRKALTDLVERIPPPEPKQGRRRSAKT